MKSIPLQLHIACCVLFSYCISHGTSHRNIKNTCYRVIMHLQTVEPL